MFFHQGSLMSKLKRIFSCTECGASQPQWKGQCPDCQAWNTLVETVVSPQAARQSWTGDAASQAKVKQLAEIQAEHIARLPTGMQEFDRALGGGLVPGSIVLIGGDPGIGKSTLLLQILSRLSQSHCALYVTGEESLQQVAMRARRLSLPEDALKLLPETHIESILSVVNKEAPQILVIDSIQTMYTDQLQSAPGSVGQIRESTAHLVRLAKSKGIAIFLVGHVTKEGALAGPRVLEHMVDTVLYFEGDSNSRYRVLRAVKNRFGAVNELGIFAMTELGLRGINNPSAIFLTRANQTVSGSVVMATWEGSRPLLVEVQALVSDSHLPAPRRVCVGLDHNRLAMLLAVLQRHVGIATYDQDVFVNVVGGVRVLETAVDLALIFAVVSSLRDRPLPTDLICFGEIGLSGELRPVTSGQERLFDAAKHGFKQAIVPKANAPQKPIEGLTVHAIDHLNEAFTVLA